jgi:hypothetical protein
MQPEDYGMADAVFRRVGAVLLLVGLIDIGIMIYCIMNGISYASSFNIFAVVLGVLLLRGNLRAASIVRSFGAFMLAGFVGLIGGWPLLQPIGLTLAELRHMAPRDLALYGALALCVVALLFWITLELNEDVVLTAFRAAGRNVRPLYLPIALGLSLAALTGGSIVLFTGGQTGRHAINLAAERLGPGYRYHVSSLHVNKTRRGTAVYGIVTAWNDAELREIPVSWRER